MQDGTVLPPVQRRLFEIDVFARFEGRLGHGHVQMIRGGDKHCIHIGAGEQLLESD